MEYNEETCIGKIIHNSLSIDWMKYNMFIMDNIYKHIPMLVFRVNESKENESLNKLVICIENYKGKLQWKVFRDPLSRKGNYLLTVAIVESIRKECFEKGTLYDERKYLGVEKFKFYCEQSIEDIPLLAKYIDKIMK